MIGAGGVVLSPLPRASIIYVGIYTLASLIGLLFTGQTHFFAFALLLSLYSPMVVIGALLSWSGAPPAEVAPRFSGWRARSISIAAIRPFWVPCRH